MERYERMSDELFETVKQIADKYGQAGGIPCERHPVFYQMIKFVDYERDGYRAIRKGVDELDQVTLWK